MDLAENFFLGHLREFAEGAEAGVVDKNVNGDALALQLIEEEFWRRGRGKIESDRLHRDAMRLQLSRHFGELVGAARD